MAGSINKVILIGNLGKDPEVRQTQQGGKIASFTLATAERWKDSSSGEMREKTEWHTIVVYNEKLVDVVERFMRKGTKVYLEGQLQTRKWTDNQGQTRYTTEVILGRFRGELTILSKAGSVEDLGDASSGFTHSTPSFLEEASASPRQKEASASQEPYLEDDEFPF